MSRSQNLDLIASDDPVFEVATKDVKTETLKDLKNENQIDNILETPKKSKSFIVHPNDFSFSEQDDSEEVLLVLRPHWFTTVPWILAVIVMIFIPFLTSFISIPDFIPLGYRFVTIIFWYIFVFIFAFEKFLGWYFNIFAITNQRVVDIDFNNILDKKFSEASLDKIQDVTSRVAGIGQTLFNYGNVLIQTASEVNEVIFEKVPNPEKIIRLLQELREGGNKK